MIQAAEYFRYTNLHFFHYVGTEGFIIYSPHKQALTSRKPRYGETRDGELIGDVLNPLFYSVNLLGGVGTTHLDPSWGLSLGLGIVIRGSRDRYRFPRRQSS